MAIDMTELFTRLGKAFYELEQLSLSIGTTLPDLAETYRDQFDGANLEMQRAVGNVGQDVADWSPGAMARFDTIKTSIENVLVETVKQDVAQPDLSVEAAWEELIRQMIGAGSILTPDHSINQATVGSDPFVIPSLVIGSGNGAVSVRNNIGQPIENAWDERVIVTLQDETSATAEGEYSLEYAESRWPRGSESSGAVPVLGQGNTLALGGSFETDDAIANAPDSWQFSGLTPGTDLFVTTVQQQEIVISGSPSSGSYRIRWTDPTGNEYISAWLSFDASAAELQTALQAIPGLGAVTVTATGVSPNLTHTVVMDGIPGTPSVFTSDQTFDQGSIAHNTPVAGDGDGFFGGRAVRLTGAGLGSFLQQTIELAPLTQYAVVIWGKATGATGEIGIGFHDGGNYLKDGAGNNDNFLTLDVSTLGATYTAQPFFIRSPRALPPLSFLRIEVTTAITGNVELDGLAILAVDPVYEGGPSIALYEGQTAWVAGDRPTVKLNNSKDGRFQDNLHRMLTQDPGTLFPSSTTPTIPDSLIGP